MSIPTSIDSALNPALGSTRAGERPLTIREQMQRAAAHCATNPGGPSPKCTGCLFVGIFFDGTGNNENNDYRAFKKEQTREMQHSNVVRLYHAHPDQIKVGTTGYYRYYIPGVGTPFEEIGDLGKYGTEGLGSAAALNGAARIIWGLTRVFNAISQYIYRDDLINIAAARKLAEDLDDLLLPQWSLDADRILRLKDLGPNDSWQKKLKGKLKYHPVKVELLTLNVFGFSRGAAEARTFINWLYDLCEKKDGGYTFAGIPLRLQFAGLFDTVASVGAASLFSITEGHMAWANKTQQIHPGVEQCVHMVAGTEVRACFPLDSVRVDARYPANVVEYVYPGSHSDVGGGYKPQALGCKDWENPDTDLQLARIAGYEMYCAALAAGVPFQTAFAPHKGGPARVSAELPPLGEQAAKALKPAPATVKAFDDYYRKAAIQPGPVEDMLRQHTSLYFTHRVHQKDWAAIPAYKRALGRPNGTSGVYEHEPRNMRRTQLALVLVIAALCDEIDRRIAAGGTGDEVLRHLYVAGAGLSLSIDLPFVAGVDAANYQKRKKLMERPFTESEIRQLVNLAVKAPSFVARWRAFLAEEKQAEIRDLVVECDGLSLLEAIQSTPVAPEISKFLDELVHDSMAGFIGFGMPEFEANGHGIAKFRRIFFGNNGDKMRRDAVQRGNQARKAALDAKRAQRRQWDREAAGWRSALPR